MPRDKFKPESCWLEWTMYTTIIFTVQVVIVKLMLDASISNLNKLKNQEFYQFAK